VSDADKIARARALFKSFQKRDARANEIIAVGGLVVPAIALEVGTFQGIVYRSAGSGEEFLHDFGTQKPKVYVRFDGGQMYIVGGAYRFTDRGFIG